MPTVTLASLKYNVYNKLQQNDKLYSAQEVVDSINESIRVTNLFSGYIQGSATTLSIGNRVWYSMPSGILFPLKIQYEGHLLQPQSIRAIGQANPRWVQQTTTSLGSPPSYWIPNGVDLFAIYPADSIGGGMLTVTGVVEPQPLVADTDTLVLPNEYSDLIVDLSTHNIQLKESGQLTQQSVVWYQSFLAKMVLLSIWKGLTQPVLKAQAIAGYRA
jgi:hypothetical protein